MSITWAILTGEYPPDPGGVSDYTAQVARALAAAGDEVHVFAPPVKPGDDESRCAGGGGGGGVRVVRLPDSFGPRGLAQLGGELNRLPRRARLLVQYVPHAFGYRALNVALPAWIVAQRGTGRPIDVMFHEVAMPVLADQPWRFNAMALLHRAMAFAIGRAADRVFVSTTWWCELLHQLLGRSRRIELLPIPSNLPTNADTTAVAAIRRRYRTERGESLVGHFGTYGPAVAPLLRETLLALLDRRPACSALLVGRGARRFTDDLCAIDPRTRNLVYAVDEVSAADAANHLAACDLLVQPYPDGATTRRSSLMAGLALGVPVVTTRGPGTEAVWNRSGGGVVLSERSGSEICSAVDSLLTDAQELRAAGRCAREFYDREFRLEVGIERLRHGAITSSSGAQAYPPA